MKQHATPEMQRYAVNKMATMRDEIFSDFIRKTFTCAKCKREIQRGEKYYRDVTKGGVAHITCPKKSQRAARDGEQVTA